MLLIWLSYLVSFTLSFLFLCVCISVLSLPLSPSLSLWVGILFDSLFLYCICPSTSLVLYCIHLTLCIVFDYLGVYCIWLIVCIIFAPLSINLYCIYLTLCIVFPTLSIKSIFFLSFFLSFSLSFSLSLTQVSDSFSLLSQQRWKVGIVFAQLLLNKLVIYLAWWRRWLSVENFSPKAVIIVVVVKILATFLRNLTSANSTLLWIVDATYCDHWEAQTFSFLF